MDAEFVRVWYKQKREIRKGRPVVVYYERNKRGRAQVQAFLRRRAYARRP